MRKILYLSLLLTLLASCSTKRALTETVVETDTMTVTRTDTVTTEKVVERSVKEYIDRWNDRVVTINLQGDTVRDVQKQVVYVEKDTYLRDSLAIYKARLDSIRNTHEGCREKVVEKKPTIRQRIGEALMWMVIGAVIMLVVIPRPKG